MTEPLFHRRQRSTNYVPFTATSLFVLLILSCCSGCCVWASKSSSSSSSSSGTAAAPWQEGSSWTTDPNDRDASKYYEIPPSTFAPGGRLYSVEAALRAARGQYPGASPTKGTVVVALPFHGGIVVVSSLPQSPYIYDDDGEISKKENHTDPIEKEENNSNENDNSLPASNRTTTTVHNNNNTSLLLWNKATPHPHHPTFVVLQQLDQHVWGITADGSIVDGQVLRQRLRLTAQQWRKQSRTITASNLARQLADAAQRQTQSLAEEGRLLASTVLLWESSSSSNSSSKSSSSVSAARTSTHPDKNIGGDDADEDDSTQQQQQQETPPPPPINIWRVDPNGQFWKCRAAVVGWGVISPHFERDLLSRWIRACRRRQRASRNDNDELCSSNSDNDTENDDKEQQQLSIKRLSFQEWEELRVQLDRDHALMVAAQTIQAVLLRPYYKHSDAAATGTEQGNYMPSIRMEGMVLDSRTGQVEFVSQTHFVELLTALQ